MSGSDTGERIDVGTGPGIDLDLTIPAGLVIDITFDDQRSATDPQTAPAFTGVTVGALPPHVVAGAAGAVNVPYRAVNIIINNVNVVNPIFFTINEGLIVELPGEDSFEQLKRHVYRVVILGTAGDRVVVHGW